MQTLALSNEVFLLSAASDGVSTDTRAVLRLECSLDCISGSVGHQQNIFIFSLSAFLLKLKKCN